MASFCVDYNEDTGETFTVRLSEWKVTRLSKKARYDFLLGGVDSHYFGHRLLIWCRWEYLSDDETAMLHRMMTSIRRGKMVRVRIFGTRDDDRFGFPLYDAEENLLPEGERGTPVDLQEDDVVESAGERFESSEMEFTLITKPAQGPGNA